MDRLGLPFKIFVEPQDYEKYAEYEEHLVVIKKNDKGLGYANTQMKKYAEQNGYDAVFKIDDDVKKIGNIEKDIERILQTLHKRKKTGAITFHYDFEFYADDKRLFTAINARMQTAYIIKTEAWKPTEKIGCFEDFWGFMQLIQNNWQTLLCGKHRITMSKMVGDGDGGMQNFNREKLAKKAILKFQQHDPSIGIVVKENKPWKLEPKFTHPAYKTIKLP